MHELRKIFGQSRGLTPEKIKLAAKSATEQRKLINSYENGSIGSIKTNAEGYYSKLSKISGQGTKNVFQKVTRWFKAFIFNAKELKDVSNFSTKNELSKSMDYMLKK